MSRGAGVGREEEPVRARRRILLRDVAAAAGVSVAQASGALSGRPDVSEFTRQRVVETAERLGYQPSEHARRLGSRQRGPIRCAIVVAGPSTAALPPEDRYQMGWFSGSLLDGALIRAAELGIDIRIIRLAEDAMADTAAVRSLMARDGADGVILQGFGDIMPEQVEELTNTGLPFVLVNKHFDSDPPVDAAAADFGAAAEDALDRLVDEGRRDLALIVADVNSSVVRDYCQGWRVAGRRHRLGARARIIQLDHGSSDGRAAAIRELFDTIDPMPTGMAAADGATAHQLLLLAQTRGLVIPRDLSVITFQAPIAPFTSPTLAAYDLKLGEVGAAAIDIVVSRLGRESAAHPTGIVRVPPVYVPGESTLGASPAPDMPRGSFSERPGSVRRGRRR